MGNLYRTFVEKPAWLLSQKMAKLRPIPHETLFCTGSVNAVAALSINGLKTSNRRQDLPPLH
jgi:hypothetical protein